MNKVPANPKLNKRLVLRHGEYTAYSVNALAVRDLSNNDEEFTHFATHKEFPRLIPKGEIWVADHLADCEGVYFIADALTRLKEIEAGVPEETAYEAGLNVERFLRHRLDGAEYRGGRPHKRVPERVYVERYITLPDEKFPVEVWLVNGGVVRGTYKTDYTEGGHGYVYRWVPKDQIWVEAALHPSEFPFIVAHEYLELRLMRDKKLDYDTAHDICSKVEFRLREGKGISKFLCADREKMTKAKLPRLTALEVFEYVVSKYADR